MGNNNVTSQEDPAAYTEETIVMWQTTSFFKKILK